MVIVTTLNQFSIRRVTEWTPWFDVYDGETHVSGCADFMDALGFMQTLAFIDQMKNPA